MGPEASLFPERCPVEHTPDTAAFALFASQCLKTPACKGPDSTRTTIALQQLTSTQGNYFASARKQPNYGLFLMEHPSDLAIPFVVLTW